MALSLAVVLSVAILLVTLQQSVISHGIDEILTAAAESSDAFNLLPDNRTVRMELDMLFPLDEYVYLHKYGQVGQETRPVEKRHLQLVHRYKRKGIHDVKKRWPDNTVPFEFETCSTPEEQRVFYQAVKDLHRYSCVKFRPAEASDGSAKLTVVDADECSANVGFLNNSQALNLTPGCRRRKGAILHELAHALGCFHEQSRSDRDEYVTVIEENLLGDPHTNFRKFSQEVIPAWGVAYDYESIMHYSEKAFSKNGNTTILATDPKFQKRMGNRQGLSYSDIQMINLLYSCDEKCAEKNVACPDEGFRGKDCKCWCRGESLVRPVMYCGDTRRPRFEGPQIVRATNPKCNAKAKTEPVKESSEWKFPEWSLVVATEIEFNETCVDQHAKCEQFARQGECSKNPVYMTVICRKACHICGRVVHHMSCLDTSANCGGAVAAGECQIDGVIMRQECGKSCGFCL